MLRNRRFRGIFEERKRVEEMNHRKMLKNHQELWNWYLESLREFGLIGAITVVMIGTFGQAFNFDGYSGIIISGAVAIIVYITGIIGAVLVRNRPNLVDGR